MKLYRQQRIHTQNRHGKAINLIVSCVQYIWLLVTDNTHLMDKVTVGQVSLFVRFLPVVSFHQRPYSLLPSVFDAT